MKYLLRILSLFLLILLMKAGFAQHEPTHNIYSRYRLLFNPANSGDLGQAFLNVRNQWTGISGSPETYTFGVQSPIGKEKKSGLGLLIQNDRYGINEQISVDLNYSYCVKLNEDHRLTFGVAGGIIDNQLDRSSVNAVNTSELTGMAEDYDYTRFGARFGFKYNWKNRFELGFALPRMLKYDDGYAFNKYFNIIGSYSILAIQDKLEIEPSVMYRNYSYDNEDPSTTYGTNNLDLNLRFEWNQTVWLGGTYRVNPDKETTAAAVGGGVNLYNIGIGYAYEMMQSSMSTFGSGTHEIVLSYNFEKTKREQEIEDMLTENQLELMERDSMTNEDYQRQLDSLKREMEALKLMMQVKDVKDWVENFKDKMGKLEDEYVDTKKNIVPDGDIISPVYFDYNKYNVKTSYFTKLDELVEAVKQNDYPIEIVGHADETGTPAYNQELSENRANAVFEYLVKKGCDKDRFIVIGRGETMPAVEDQASEKARALNRRVEIRYRK